MKRKITLAVAVMLVLVMALSSCGVGSTKIEKILNADYDLTAEVYGTATNVSELDGYSVNNEYSSSYFIIFTKADETTLMTTYKVFSMKAAKVVATFTNTDKVTFTISAYSSVPAFAVTSTPIPAEGDTKDPEPTYYLYDATGAQVSSTIYNPDSPYMVGDDLVIYNYVGYTVDDDGKFEKKMDIPEYLLDNVRIVEVTDKYYYAVGYNSNYSLTDITVYSHEFEVVSQWYAPSFVDELDDVYILNNGDIFVQYAYALDEDAVDFDFYDEQGKYDLTTLVIDAKNGKAKEIKMEYVVAFVEPNWDLYDADEENNMFTDKFENIAYVYPIVNKNIDHSEMAMEIVLLGNNGKIKAALDYVDNMTDIGKKVADDLYLVPTTANYVLINGNGKVVKTFNKSMKFVGEYILGSVAIYDLDFEVVYDLRENKATGTKVVGDSIFVTVKTDKGYDIIAFNGGNQKTIYSYNRDSEANDTFGYIDEEGYYDYGIYYILSAATNEYTYYNANGDVMIKTTEKLTVVRAAEDTIVLTSTSAEGTVKYYVASIIENAK